MSYLTQLNPVFCLPIGVEIDDLAKMIEWVYGNLTAKTVVWLSGEQIESYYFQGLWQNVTNVMQGLELRSSEDEWIFELTEIKAIRENFINSQFAKDKI